MELYVFIQEHTNTFCGLLLLLLLLLRLLRRLLSSFFFVRKESLLPIYT